MGYEIVYCYGCQVRLTDAEFRSGLAFRVGQTTACERCVEALLIPLSPDERMAVLNPGLRPAPERTPRLRRQRPWTG